MNRLLATTTFFSLLAGPASADTIEAASAHIAGPTTTIDFGVSLWPSLTPITNEFAGDGIEIQGGMYFTNGSSGFGVDLGGGFLTRQTLSTPPMVIEFSTPVSAASFTFHQVGPNPTTFTALLSSVVVETFTYTGGDNQSSSGMQIFGFENILFDEIHIEHLFDWNLDNLAFVSAGSSFAETCSGDGGDQMGCTDCPCGNDAPAGTVGGCVNSAGTSTRLLGSGSASIAAADLRFEGSGAPPANSAVLTSGNALAPANMANPCFGLSSGIQSVNLDGLRCAVQNVLRHGVRPSDASGDIGVTTNGWGTPNGFFNFGAFVPGQAKHFQIIHRDDAAQVCGTGQNTSQAVTVTFTP